MNRTDAIKKVWSLVERDKIKEAEKIAIEYSIEMCFIFKERRIKLWQNG